MNRMENISGLLFARPSSHYAFSLAMPVRQGFAFTSMCSSSRKIKDFSGALRLLCRRQYFDKGFGDIAAAAWYGGIWARQWFKGKAFIKIDGVKYIKF